jgi:hypothetical protein
MKLHKIVAGIFTLMSALWLTASDARAQQYVECRSQNYQYRECPVPWGRSELVRRLSDRQCVEHQTWGQGRGFVWVHQGCAANFGEARGGGNGDWQPGQGEIACNSDRNRYRECRTNWRNARLVRQTSNAQCVEDQTWGFRRGLLWVDRGCAGIFSEGWGGGGSGGSGGSGGQQIECNSDRNRYRECRTGDWRAAQLIRQTSNAQCIEGRTWGYGRGMLWVDQGCAGVFAPAQNWGGGWGGGGRKLTCNSQNNRYRECAASGWRNARLLRQTSRASCIEGRTWGLRNGRIWVDQGCAGDFGETR